MRSLTYSTKTGGAMTLKPLRSTYLILALIAIVTTGCSTAPKETNSSVNRFVPKKDLKIEEAVWTFAPNVPPSIERNEPRLLKVSWKILETKKEIAPNLVYQTYWTFEGQVPGPMLRGKVGDVFQIELKNDAKNLHSHNIDFHFVTGPGGGATALNTGPGNKSVIEVRATTPGLFMYHCATADIPTHISNGMYGYVLIEPKEGLPKVDHEFYIVQSEFYTHDDSPGEKFLSLDHLKNEHPQFVVFNGKVGALTGENSLHVYKNEKIRLYVGNAGLNLASNFHVIGEIFDKVYPEADLISPPRQGIQTTLIPTGGASVVEFTPEIPGNLILVDHALVRAIYKGAAGIITVHGSYDYQEKEIFQTLITGSANLVNSESSENSTAPDSHSMTPPKPANPIEQKSEKKTESNTPSTTQNLAEESYIVSGNSITVDILSSSSNPGSKNLSHNYLVIKPGTTVTWVNGDPGGVHSITALDNSFRTPQLKTGNRSSVKFDKKGIYTYYCDPHTWIQGTVEVK